MCSPPQGSQLIMNELTVRNSLRDAQSQTIFFPRRGLLHLWCIRQAWPDKGGKKALKREKQAISTCSTCKLIHMTILIPYKRVQDVPSNARVLEGLCASSHTGCPPRKPYRAEAVKSWWESRRTPGGLELLFNLLTCWEQLFRSLFLPLHPFTASLMWKALAASRADLYEGRNASPCLKLSIQFMWASNGGAERSGTIEDNWEGNSGVVSSVVAGQVQGSILRRLYELIS